MRVMRDMIIAVCLTALSIGAADAQIRRFAQPACSHTSYCAPTYAAPVYAAPVVAAPYAYPLVQTYQPIAVYVMPGTPTASINVYPGSLSVIQPLPVQLTFNITQPAAPVIPPTPAPAAVTVPPVAPVIPSVTMPALLPGR